MITPERMRFLESIKEKIAEDPEGYVEERLGACIDRIIADAHRKYVVRIVHDHIGDDIIYMLECLTAATVQIHRQDPKSMCFDVMPPRGCVNSKEWAGKLSVRLTEKGFNAVAAPEWVV